MPPEFDKHHVPGPGLAVPGARDKSDLQQPGKPSQVSWEPSLWKVALLGKKGRRKDLRLGGACCCISGSLRSRGQGRRETQKDVEARAPQWRVCTLRLPPGPPLPLTCFLLGTHPASPLPSWHPSNLQDQGHASFFWKPLLASLPASVSQLPLSCIPPALAHLGTRIGLLVNLPSRQ